MSEPNIERALSPADLNAKPLEVTDSEPVDVDANVTPAVDKAVSSIVADTDGGTEVKRAVQRVLDAEERSFSKDDMQRIKRMKLLARFRDRRILSRLATPVPPTRRSLPHPSEDDRH